MFRLGYLAVENNYVTTMWLKDKLEGSAEHSDRIRATQIRLRRFRSVHHSRSGLRIMQMMQLHRNDRNGPVFILGLSGWKFPPPKKIKMNYAKIEFLSTSGVIFSPASGGFAPRPPPGLCLWSRFAFTV